MPRTKLQSKVVSSVLCCKLIGHDSSFMLHWKLQEGVEGVEPISLGIYVGYMNCYAFALQDHELTEQPLEKVIDLWLSGRQYLNMLPK